MKEELVSYNTAKLAKEKGFNIFCEHYFCNDDFSRNGKDYGLNKPDIQFYQPTQSLLQKWIREIYNWNIIVFNDDGDKGKNLRYNYELRYILPSFKHIDKKSKVGNYKFKTYEEALEEGLQEALKLI